MAVTTKKLFPATTNATTTVFSPVGIQLNNQDDLDVYVTLSGGTRVLQLRQSTGSTATSNHPQVNDTTGLYFPAVSAGTTLYNYQLSTDNNTITFNSALPQGAVVFCERRTRDADSSYTTFASGSTIRATDLNNSSTESNFTAQDGRNKAITLEGVLFRGDQPSTNFVTSDHIVNGSIVNADINASADIENTKLADGLLKAGITVNSDNIVNGSIVNDDINSSANIDGTKIATASIPPDRMASGTLPSNVTITSTNIAPGTVVEADIETGALDNRYYTKTELDPTASAGQNVLDARYYTESEADARFYNLSSAEEIQSGETWVAADNKVATTAAIDARIIDLVDDVGGFVPIPNETSFPTANPDVNNGTGTLVSIKEISSARTPSSGTVTIADGAGTGNTVTITGCGSTVLPVGFGVIVETTSTLHTYTFHRLTPKATETTTVAGISSDVTTVAGIASDVTAVAGNNTDVTTVAGSISNVNTVSSSITSVNNASANITSIANFGDQYQVASSNPTTDGGGNALAEGDLYFNTTADELKVYNGNAWVSGVTATGNFALITGNNFTGDNTYADGAKATFGTGSDFSIYHVADTETRMEDTGSGGLIIKAEPHIKLQQYGTNDNLLVANGGGSVELYHDNSKKLETGQYGVDVTGSLSASNIDLVDDAVIKLGDDDDFQIVHQSSNSNSVIRETGGGILSLQTNGSSISFYDSTNAVTMAQFNTGGNCTFKHGSTSRLATTSTGIDVAGDITVSGTVDGVDIAALSTTVGNITTDVVSDTTPQLGGDLQSNGHDIDFADNDKAIFGTDGDLEIYHSGQHSVIRTTTGSVGNLNIRSDNDVLIGTLTDGNNFITCTEGAQVELHHGSNYTKRLETTSAGISVSGDIAATGDIDIPSNQMLKLGNTDSFEIFQQANNANAIIRTTGSTNLSLRTDGTQINFIDHSGVSDVTMAAFNTGGSCEFKHGTTTRLATSSTGIDVTGDVYASGNIGKDSNDYITFTDNTQMDVYINGNNEFRFEADGDFHADGDITAFSTTTASDARLKTDINTINDALGIVGKLRGVSYKWLRDGKSDIGVIAQEVEQVIPEVVKTKNMPTLDGMEEVKTVDYGKMVGVLINAVNELKAEIEELKNAKTTR